MSAKTSIFLVQSYEDGYVVDFVKGVLATCVKVDGTDAVMLLSAGTGERPHVTGYRLF